MINTNIIFEKYNNLITVEQYMNNYLYKPLKIKKSEIIPFERPIKFHTNKIVENFKQEKNEVLNTLQEFRNLYVHFIKNKTDKYEGHDKHRLFSSGFHKNKINNINNILLGTKYEEDKNLKIKNKRPFSKMDSLKRASLLLKSSQKRNSINIMRKRNNQYFYNINKNNNRIMSNNSYLKIKFDININNNKDKNDNNDNGKNKKNFLVKNNSNPFFSFKSKKSKLSLMEDIIKIALNNKLRKDNDFNSNNDNITGKSIINNFNGYNNSLSIKNINKKMKKLKSLDSVEEYKYKYNNNYIRKNNKKSDIKYIEIPRNNFNFSDICLIERQIGPNTKQKFKKNKRPRFPLTLFSSKNRPMSSLERYYLYKIHINKFFIFFIYLYY